jgi:hypothetical protein
MCNGSVESIEKIRLTVIFSLTFHPDDNSLGRKLSRYFLHKSAELKFLRAEFLTAGTVVAQAGDR